MNIALSLLEQAYEHKKGRFYLLTGDTDQIPTAKMIMRLFPDIQFYWVYPLRDKIPDEIRQTVPKKRILALNWSYYRQAQMPPLLEVDGKTVKSPYHTLTTLP